jgi:hypothetical protein
LNEDGTFASSDIPVISRNFVIKVSFDSSVFDSWSFGITFRISGDRSTPETAHTSAFIFFVNSDSTWKFGYVQNAASPIGFSLNGSQHSRSDHISGGAMATNVLEIIVINDSGYVYINGFYTATIDLTPEGPNSDSYNNPGPIELVVMDTSNTPIKSDNIPQYRIITFGSLDPNCKDTNSPLTTGFWGTCS